MWQELIVTGAVLAASLFLIRQYWPGRRPAKDLCRGCKSCGGDKPCAP